MEFGIEKAAMFVTKKEKESTEGIKLSNSEICPIRKSSDSPPTA